MTIEKTRKLKVLSRQLTENLMSAALCAKEIDALANDHVEDEIAPSLVASGNGQHRHEAKTKHRPLLDEATLSVVWRGKTLHLGHTRGFWLLTRLAKRDCQYVTHLDLLREIWDDEFADTCVLRAVVHRLRRNLRQGGMADLAEAIVGHHGRYMLDLK
jgi:DNA-binding response OmpR family regulator